MASQRLSTGSLKPRGGKLQKKPPEGRRVSMEIPERFQVDDEEEEDAGKVSEDNPETYVQQSVYGLIAAASEQR